MDVGYTNDPFVIAKNPKATAIDSALQVDLDGPRCCADSLGPKFYSGVGGADRLHLRSLAFRRRQGDPRHALDHEQGHQQDRARADARSRRRHDALARPSGSDFTEYGAVNLYGRSLQERAPLIISVRSPRPPRDARPRGFRASRRASPLHQGDDFRKKKSMRRPNKKPHAVRKSSGPHVAFFCRARPVATRTFSTRHSAVPANLSVQALSGQSASVRRRADGYAVADLRYRRPRATQGDAPCRANNARRYARTRNRRESRPCPIAKPTGAFGAPVACIRSVVLRRQTAGGPSFHRRRRIGRPGHRIVRDDRTGILNQIAVGYHIQHAHGPSPDKS